MPNNNTDVQLYHGDCFVEMKRIKEYSVDMVLTDPPYGTTACKWDSVIPLDRMWGRLNRLVKPSAAIVMTASQPFTSALVMSNIKMFKYCWVWEKNYGSNFAVARKQPFKEHEDICVFYKKQPKYNPIMEPRSETGKKFVANCSYDKRKSDHSNMTNGKANRDPNWRLPGSVRKFNMQVGLHPTQKPVALMEYLIRTYTNEGDIVLDFTMGSGTTGVACVNLNRKFIGIEMDDKYFKIAQERIGEARGRIEE